MHPDFGGDAGGGDIYGFPFIVVDGSQTKKTVTFVNWPEQSDGVGVPFYPVPDQAITLNGWVDGGQPGNVDQRGYGDALHRRSRRRVNDDGEGGPAQ